MRGPAAVLVTCVLLCQSEQLSLEAVHNERCLAYGPPSSAIYRECRARLAWLNFGGFVAGVNVATYARRWQYHDVAARRAGNLK